MKRNIAEKILQLGKHAAYLLDLFHWNYRRMRLEEARYLSNRPSLWVKGITSHRDESIPSSFRYAGGSLPTLPRDLGNRLLDIVKLDDYQEPYQALKYAPYYSYSTVVMEMKDMMLNNKGTNINHSGMRRSNAPTPTHRYTARARDYALTHHTHTYTSMNIHTHSTVVAPVPTMVHPHTSRQQSIRPDRNQYAIPFCARSSFAISSAAVYANGAVDTSYDYAVPELGTVPLLNQDAGAGRGATVSSAAGDQDSLFSKSSRTTKTEDKKVRRSHSLFLPLYNFIPYWLGFVLINSECVKLRELNQIQAKTILYEIESFILIKSMSRDWGKLIMESIRIKFKKKKCF